MDRATDRKSMHADLCSCPTAARSAAASIFTSGLCPGAPASCTCSAAAATLFPISSTVCIFARKLASLPMASSSGDPSSPIKNSAFAFSSAIRASGALEHSRQDSVAFSSCLSSSSAEPSSSLSPRKGALRVAGPLKFGEKCFIVSISIAPRSRPGGTPITGSLCSAASSSTCRFAKRGHRCFRM